MKKCGMTDAVMCIETKYFVYFVLNTISERNLKTIEKR